MFVESEWKRPCNICREVDEKLDNMLDVYASMKIKRIRVFTEEIMMCVEWFILHILYFNINIGTFDTGQN